MPSLHHTHRQRSSPLTTWLVLGCGLLSACAPPGPPPPLRGATMGTVYTVKVTALPATLSQAELQALVERELQRVNAAMSTYDPQSEISRFNQHRGDDWFPVGRDLAEIVLRARDVGARTAGAFDITVGPLVEAWGFGATGPRDSPPSGAELAAARTVIGMDRLSQRVDPPALRKSVAALQIDLSAIAKGYAVDRVAAALDAAGIHNYLVEIGGELRIRGRRHDGAMWRVGIEQPAPDGRRVQRALPMHRDGAVATSGDYRNFFETNGQRYAHIIDPRTGMPAKHQLASVTVIADNCETADAWATALSVLGTRDGYRLAENEGLAALFMEREGETFAERPTQAFDAWLSAADQSPQETENND